MSKFGDIIRMGNRSTLQMPDAFHRKAANINPTARTAVYRDGNPVRTEWTATKAIKDGLKASSWVYSCISTIAENGGAVPWFGGTKDADGNFVQNKTSKLSMFLETLNPNVGSSMILETWIYHLLLTGNSMSVIVRAKDTSQPGSPELPKYLWPVSPDDLKPVPDQNGYIAYYKPSDAYKKLNKVDKIPVEDVIHFMLTNPASLYWGMSPMEAAANSIDTDADAVTWNRYSFKNRAQPAGILKLKSEGTDDQYDDVMADMEKYYMGAEQARTPMVIEADTAEWIQTANGPLEMDFLNGRRFTREEISAIFKVNPVLLGSMDASTYNNVKEAQKQLWNRAIIPILYGFEAALDIQLAQQFGEDQRVAYSLDGIPAIVADTIDKLESIKILWGMGYPLNDAIKAVGARLPEVDGGDVSYVPTNVIPADDINSIASSGSDGNDL